MKRREKNIRDKIETVFLCFGIMIGLLCLSSCQNNLEEAPAYAREEVTKELEMTATPQTMPTLTTEPEPTPMPLEVMDGSGYLKRTVYSDGSMLESWIIDTNIRTPKEIMEEYGEAYGKSIHMPKEIQDLITKHNFKIEIIDGKNRPYSIDLDKSYSYIKEEQDMFWATKHFIVIPVVAADDFFIKFSADEFYNVFLAGTSDGDDVLVKHDKRSGGDEEESGKYVEYRMINVREKGVKEIILFVGHEYWDGLKPICYFCFIVVSPECVGENRCEISSGSTAGKIKDDALENILNSTMVSERCEKMDELYEKYTFYKGEKTRSEFEEMFYPNGLFRGSEVWFVRLNDELLFKGYSENGKRNDVKYEVETIQENNKK